MFSDQVGPEAPAATAAAPPVAPRFFFLTVFWGEGFRSLFTDFCLPSLLAEGNIPALRNKSESRFVIVTTEEDWAEFRSHPIHDALLRHIEPVFVPMAMPGGDLTPGQKLLLSSAGHKAATEIAFQSRACTMVVAPDVIFSDGSVAALQRRAEAGTPLVLALGLRAEQDGLIDELKRRGLIKPGLALALSGRETVALLMRHMHSELKTYEWDRDYFTDYPVASFWRIPDSSGLLVHSLGFTPIYADYRGLTAHRTGVLDSSTIDGAYLYDNFGAAGRFDVIQDSDELMQLSMTREAVLSLPLRPRRIKRLPLLGDAVKVLEAKVFAQSTIDPLRQAAFGLPIRLHSGEVSAAQWHPVERRARRLVGRTRGSSSAAARFLAAFIARPGPMTEHVYLVSIRQIRRCAAATAEQAARLARDTYFRLRDFASRSLLPKVHLALARARFLATHPRRGTRRIFEHLGGRYARDR